MARHAVFTCTVLTVAMLLVAACSDDVSRESAPAAPPSGDPAPAAAATPQAPDPAEEAAIRAAAEGVFASYVDEGATGTGLTPAFEAAWDHALGPDGALDYDPYCECQDYGDVAVRIDGIEIDNDRAIVSLTFTNFGTAIPKRMILQRIDGDWLLDDINDGEVPSLHRAMADGPAGAYNAF